MRKKLDAPLPAAATLPQATACGALETSPSPSPTPTPSPSPEPEPRAPKPGKVEPLAKSRFKVEFTADEELFADIQRAKDLLGPRLPRGELNELFGLALRNIPPEPPG